MFAFPIFFVLKFYLMEQSVLFSACVMIYMELY